jgi:acetylornithine deacetylase/succinyl-diaminopimelate desuccinylase-like protein
LIRPNTAAVCGPLVAPFAPHHDAAWQWMPKHPAAKSPLFHPTPSAADSATAAAASANAGHPTAGKTHRGSLTRRRATTGTAVDVETRLMRDAFRLDAGDPFVPLFQAAYSTLTGERLPVGGEPYVDDGNSFWSAAGVPAVTHGPTAGGAHTTAEWVNMDDLVRVARLYALVATLHCPGGPR